ncbi:MAG: 6,7-dimethyl-8-ribityllumazine synthase [Phycisphaerales bacterium]
MNDQVTEIPLTPADSPRLAIVVSRYNAWITDKLAGGAKEALARLAPNATAVLVPAPGAFELVPVAAAACDSGRYDGVVCLGCVIRGETRHDEYINMSVAQGITELSARTGVPVSFGLLTVNSPDQAEARAGGDLGNKGAEAVEAVLATIAAIDAVRAGAPNTVGSKA